MCRNRTYSFCVYAYTSINIFQKGVKDMKIKDKKESIIVDITKYMKAKEEEKRKNQLIDTIAGLGLMAIVIFILVWWSIFAFIFNAISM